MTTIPIGHGTRHRGAIGFDLPIVSDQGAYPSDASLDRGAVQSPWSETADVATIMEADTTSIAQSSRDEILHLDAPDNIATGDLLIAFMNGYGGNSFVAVPTGWTEIFENETGVLNGTAIGMYYKVAVLADETATNYEWETDGRSRSTAWIIRVEGADTDDPVDVASSAFSTVVDNHIMCPSVTTTGANSLVIRTCSFRGPDSGMLPPKTEIVNLENAYGSSSQCSASWERGPNTPGPTGHAGFGFTGSSTAVVYTIAINSAVEAADAVLTGTITGTGSTTGALTLATALAGTTTGAGSVTGDLDSGAETGIDLTGTIAGAGTTAGGLTLETALAGTLAGAGTVGGNISITTAIALTGTLAGTGDISGAIQLATGLAGSINGLGSAQAAMVLATEISGTVTGTGSISADLRLGLAVSLAGTINGTGTVSADLQLATAVALAGTITGAGQVSASLGLLTSLSGTLAGSSTASAAALQLATGLTGSITSSGDILAALQLATALSGTTTGAGTLAGALAGIYRPPSAFWTLSERPVTWTLPARGTTWTLTDSGATWTLGAR